MTSKRPGQCAFRSPVASVASSSATPRLSVTCRESVAATPAFRAWNAPGSGMRVSTDQSGPASETAASWWPRTPSYLTRTSTPSPTAARPAPFSPTVTTSPPACSVTAASASPVVAVTSALSSGATCALSRAISSTVSPRTLVCSSVTLVTALAVGSTTLVASYFPPIPTSSTATSTSSRPKCQSPIAVMTSKNVGASPVAARSLIRGWTASTNSATVCFEIGRPSIRTRSRRSSKWGDV